MEQLRYEILGEQIDPMAAHALAKELSVPPLVATLLLIRGIDSYDKAMRFLCPCAKDVHDPMDLPDMAKAVKRIFLAMQNNEKVCIYGDYDVDGVTAVAVLHRYLYSRGVNVCYYIPSREGEGYGMNADAVNKIHEMGVSLIITVDTGTTAVAETELAKQLGMDVVITDHHTCLESLPDAVAVVNPTRPDSQYPFGHLAGVGVSFKLVCALENAHFPEMDYISCFEKMLDRYGDLVTLGTIADMMVLMDENRYIVKRGLAIANKTRNQGLSALIDVVLEGKDNRSGKRRNLSAQMIGFSIAPKINAAGRIASADFAEELFLTESEQRAIMLSQKLCELNKERQGLENEIVALAVKQVQEVGLEDDPVLVLGDEGWHPGVVGIAASRILERYGKPTIMVSFDGELGKGSVRGAAGFDAMQALGYASDLLVKYGGHVFAAGLTVMRENFIDFRRRVCEYATIYCKTLGADTKTVRADAYLSPMDLNVSTVSMIGNLAPFGAGNESPQFLLSGVTVADMIPLSGGKHTKLILEGQDVRISALMFGIGPHACLCKVGDSVDVFGGPELNEYAGNTTVQFMVKKLYLARDLMEQYQSEKLRYLNIMQGECEMDDFPTRAEFAAVYRFLSSAASSGKNELGYRYCQALCGKISYPQLRVILDIFKETKLLEYRPEKQGDRFFFAPVSVSEKVNIEKTPLYRRLKPEF